MVGIKPPTTGRAFTRLARATPATKTRIILTVVDITREQTGFKFWLRAETLRFRRFDALTVIDRVSIKFFGDWVVSSLPDVHTIGTIETHIDPIQRLAEFAVQTTTPPKLLMVFCLAGIKTRSAIAVA